MISPRLGMTELGVRMKDEDYLVIFLEPGAYDDCLESNK